MILFEFLGLNCTECHVRLSKDWYGLNLCLAGAKDANSALTAVLDDNILGDTGN